MAVAGLAALLSYARRRGTAALKIDFSDETVGAEPKSFVSVVGIWRIENEGEQQGAGRRRAAMERGADRGRRSPTRRARSTASAMPNFSTACRPMRISPIPSPRTSQDFRQRRHHRALRRHFRPHRPGRRHPVQPQAERRLSDRPRQSARKQSRAVEVRKGQALLGEMDPQHADRDAGNGTTSRSGSPAPRSKAISTASSSWSTSCRSPSPGASACGPRPTATCTSTTSP